MYFGCINPIGSHVCANQSHCCAKCYMLIRRFPYTLLLFISISAVDHGKNHAAFSNKNFTWGMLVKQKSAFSFCSLQKSAETGQQAKSDSTCAQRCHFVCMVRVDKFREVVYFSSKTIILKKLQHHKKH